MKRRDLLAVPLALFLLAGCASDGTGAGGGAGFYDGYYYDDWYGYGGGCCVDNPGDIGPPHPEHPIVLPPDAPRPEHPIATPPKAEPKSMPSPRPAAPMRGGGGGRGGGRR